MDPKSKTPSAPYNPLEEDEKHHQKQWEAPGYQPHALGYPQQAPAYQPPAPGYHPQAFSYPQEAPAYPQQPPPAYPQQTLSYPQQPPPAYPQQTLSYPQQPQSAYPQQIPVPGYPPQAPGFKPQAPGYHPQPQPDQGQLNDFTEVLVNNPGGLGEDGTFGASFGHKSVRAAFVRKVYSILMVQLLVTVGIIALFIFHAGIKNYVTHSFPMYISAYVVFLTTYFTLTCCTEIRRQHPHNLILLVVFTLSMAYMSGVISAFYDVEHVFIAMGITVVVCLGVSLFAIQTKYDITGWGLYLFVASLVILVFGIISIFVAIYAGNKIMNLVYSGLVALLFSMYLVYDTQQIVGGRKIELSPEEYVYGALQLYVDMMEIFLAILRLVGRK